MTYKLRDEHGRFILARPRLRDAEREARRATRTWPIVAVVDDETDRIVSVVQRDGKNVTLTRPDSV